MKYIIAMSGASGFVGSNLKKAFQAMGWEVIPLGRDDFSLTPEELARKMKGAVTVINLAGAPVINRWTSEYKKIMYDSRINVTRSLVKACSVMEIKPGSFISTSAIGHYAAGGPHTEKNHVCAEDFLGKLTTAWEAEAQASKALGIRTIIFRFGIVLGNDGGALQEMVKPFKMGVGGTIGDGSQPFSWIHITDLIHAFKEAIEDSSYEGKYNLTSPHPTTNKALTKTIGKVLNRPALVPVPKFVLKLQFGEGAEVLTSGQEVIPERLLDKGFEFRFSELDEALRDCLS